MIVKFKFYKILSNVGASSFILLIMASILKATLKRYPVCRRARTDQNETEGEEIEDLSVENIEEAGSGDNEDRIEVCREEDLPPSYASIFFYPKVESEEAVKRPPPYRDSMLKGRDANGFRVSVETVSAAIHGRAITRTIRKSSNSAIIV